MPVIKQEPSLFGMSDHLRSLSESGDPLAVLERTVDFEQFRDLLEAALAYSDGRKGPLCQGSCRLAF